MIRRNEADYFVDLRNVRPHALFGPGMRVSFVPGRDIAGRAVAHHIEVQR
jgi:hypothetical protein